MDNIKPTVQHIYVKICTCSGRLPLDCDSVCSPPVTHTHNAALDFAETLALVRYHWDTVADWDVYRLLHRLRYMMQSARKKSAIITKGRTWWSEPVSVCCVFRMPHVCCNQCQKNSLSEVPADWALMKGCRWLALFVRQRWGARGQQLYHIESCTVCTFSPLMHTPGSSCTSARQGFKASLGCVLSGPGLSARAAVWGSGQGHTGLWYRCTYVREMDMRERSSHHNIATLMLLLNEGGSSKGQEKDVKALTVHLSVWKTILKVAWLGEGGVGSLEENWWHRVRIPLNYNGAPDRH